jgi:hypothetical protein
MKIQVQTLAKLKRLLYLHLSHPLLYLTLLTLILLLLNTKGISHEATVSLQGDMPRYLMNGVYFHDFFRDLPLTHPLTYTYHYYARYPALSLGHHPLLLGVAEAPFYALFGVSVFSARLTIIFFSLLGVVFWFGLIRLIYGETVAFFSSLLWITTPFIVDSSRVVMSEIPTLALIIVTTYFFYQYLRLNQNKYLFTSAITLVLSAYAKHLALFIVPIFLCYFILTKGIRKLFTKEMILVYFIVGVLLLPLVPLTLKFSQTNVTWVSSKAISSKRSLSRVFLYYPKALWNHQLTPPVLILSLVSMGLSLYRREKQALLFWLWIIGFYLQTSYVVVKDPRYIIYWIPAFCLFAATPLHLPQHRSAKVLITSLLLLIAGYQFALAFQSEPEYAQGYEEAAKYVVENPKGESVLFSANVDTGYFIFFVRKHDPLHRLIVLRADKVLATSRLSRIVEERIAQREQIYEILRDFGVGYVVLEDMAYPSAALEWLRQEVQGERFILRKKIPLKSNQDKLWGVSVNIYEYKDYQPAGRGKRLQMNIPLMGDSIGVEFDELLDRKTSDVKR